METKCKNICISSSAHIGKTLATLSVVTAAALALPAQAAQIEELVVTAQKREESSQSIGAAITALSADKLVSSDFNNIEDLDSLVPSVQIGESFGFAQMMVRGIGTDNPFAGGDPSVAMHVDGVVTGQSSAQFGSIFDVERVEVLRGPQGTLYGRNATGGSVNIITKRPTEETSGYARMTLGNYSLAKFEGAVSGPLSDNLLGRVAVRGVERGGYGTNIATGEDIDDASQRSVRGQLLWMPNDTMDLRFVAEFHDEDDANYMPKFRAPSYDPASIPALEPQPTTGVRASNPRDLNSNVELQNQRDQSSFTLEYNWDINANWSLTSISNYQEFEKVPQADFDMTAEDFYIWSEAFDTEQMSEEIQLNYEGEGWHGLIGLYYYGEEIVADNRLDLPLVPQFVADGDPTLAGCGTDSNASDNILGVPDDELCFHFTGSSETESYAIFANASFDLTADLSLNLGGRYSREDKEGNTTRWTAPGAPVLTFADEKSFNEFSPSVRLEWQANEDVLVYGGYSEGFKSGIFLTGQRSPVLDPEIVDAYELGMKGMFLDRQLRLNMAAFMYDYSNLQQGRSVPAGTSGFTLVYENAASSEIKGLEAEFTWLATDNLSFDGSVTYLDAVFDDYVTTDPFDTVNQQLGLIDPSVDLSQQLAGNSMVQAPEWAWNLSATYDAQVSEDWMASTTLAASYKSRVYFSQFNHAELAQDEVTKWNANVMFRSQSSPWSLNVWGKNLTDEDAYMGTFILNSSRTNAGFLAAPRTFGITAGYEF